MALIGLIVIVLYLVVSEQSRVAKSHKKIEEMKKNGDFLPRSGERFSMIYQDVCRDWRGEKKLFPKEYIPYFERNSKALDKYSFGLTAQQEIKEGFKPTLCVGGYNKFTYDPFAGFTTMYAEKIKIFNETGVYYF